MHAQASDYGTESHAHAFSKPAREVKYVEAGREGSPLMHATTQVEHPEVNAVTQTSLSGGEGTHATTQVEHPEVNAVTQTSVSGGQSTHAGTQVERPETSAVTQTSLSGGQGTHASAQAVTETANSCTQVLAPSSHCSTQVEHPDRHAATQMSFTGILRGADIDPSGPPADASTQGGSPSPTCLLYTSPSPRD